MSSLIKELASRAQAKPCLRSLWGHRGEGGQERLPPTVLGERYGISLVCGSQHITISRMENAEHFMCKVHACTQACVMCVVMRENTPDVPIGLCLFCCYDKILWQMLLREERKKLFGQQFWLIAPGSQGGRSLRELVACVTPSQEQRSENDCIRCSAQLAFSTRTQSCLGDDATHSRKVYCNQIIPSDVPTGQPDLDNSIDTIFIGN